MTGCEVRLRTIRIDRSRIYLSFGDGIDTMRVEFLHGMADKQEVMNVKQKYGVKPVYKQSSVAGKVRGQFPNNIVCRTRKKRRFYNERKT